MSLMEDQTGEVYRIDGELYCLVKVLDSKGRIGYMPVCLDDLRNRWEEPLPPKKMLLTLEDERMPGEYLGSLRETNIAPMLPIIRAFPDSSTYHTNTVFYITETEIICPIMFQDSKSRTFYALISVSSMGYCRGIRQSINIHQELQQYYEVLGHIPSGTDMSCFIEPLIRR